MREIIIQAMVACCFVGLTVEAVAWCLGRWLGEDWWGTFLGGRAAPPAVVEVAREAPRKPR